MFKAAPKSCGFQTLKLGRLFILWDPILLWIALYTYFLLSTMAFCPTIDLGSSMSNGYWRTFCLMRWSSSYSTAGRSKRIISGDRWNLSGILQLILASPKSRALSCLSSAPQCKTSLFTKWAPKVVWMSFHCLLLQTLIFFPSMVDLSQGSSMSSGYSRTFCFMRRDSSFSTARRSEGIL